MTGQQTSLELGANQPLLGSPIGIPLLFLTVVCGALGWLVWAPYGVVFGVLPPAVVFGFALAETREASVPKLPPTSPASTLTVGGGVDLVTDLNTAGIFTGGETGPLALSEQFAADWRRRMVEMGGRAHDQSALAGLLGVDATRVEVGWDEQGLFARLDGGNIGRWMSRAAFVADLTAVMAFRRHYPAWWRLSTANRNRVLSALRLSLRRCPTCDGDVEIDTERVTEERAKRRHVTVVCLACASELFDAVVDEASSPVANDENEAGKRPRSTR